MEMEGWRREKRVFMAAPTTRDRPMTQARTVLQASGSS